MNFYENLLKILAKNNDLGKYALPRNAVDNTVIIAVDSCLTADAAGDDSIVACNYSNVGIACFNPDLGSDHINTSKVNNEMMNNI